VQFAGGIRALEAQGCDIFLEIGPAPVLAGMGLKCLAGKELLWLPSLRKGTGDSRQILDSVARLYVAGVNLDWGRFHGVHTKVPLPTYPFQRERYWVDIDAEPPKP